MSPVFSFELSETRRDAQRFARGLEEFENDLLRMFLYHFRHRRNERRLVSRNKREGRYMERLKKNGTRAA